MWSGRDGGADPHDPANYERRLPDGTVEVYSLADRAASLANRRTFSTSLTDPQGHTIEYTYDSNSTWSPSPMRSTGRRWIRACHRSRSADESHRSLRPLRDDCHDAGAA
jgi:hypothetical protein